MLLEKDQIQLDLPVVASILHYAGYNGLLSYLALETHKRVLKDEYLSFEKSEKTRFLENKEDWELYSQKLVDMGLAVKNGSHFITKSKMTSWKGWCEANFPNVLSLNGSIVFEMTELYKMKNNEELRDILYLSIIENINKGKSMSRSFIFKFTGLSSEKQKKLEDRYEGKYLTKETHHIPLNDKEQKETDKPLFNGVVSPKEMICVKTNRKKSNCKVIQLGNKVKIKKLKVSNFVYKKISKASNNVKKVAEVQDWENFDMVIDCSTEATSSKFRGILSTKDTRKISWKDFKHYDYDNVKVFDQHGNLTSFRTIISE